MCMYVRGEGGNLAMGGLIDVIRGTMAMVAECLLWYSL